MRECNLRELEDTLGVSHNLRDVRLHKSYNQIEGLRGITLYKLFDPPPVRADALGRGQLLSKPGYAFSAEHILGFDVSLTWQAPLDIKWQRGVEAYQWCLIDRLNDSTQNHCALDIAQNRARRGMVGTWPQRDKHD